MYVCMYICSRMYVHTWVPATRTRRASASSGATILPERYAIERLLDNQNECLGPDPRRGRVQIWENFLPADRRAWGTRAVRRRGDGRQKCSSDNNSYRSKQAKRQIGKKKKKERKETMSEQRKQKSRKKTRGNIYSYIISQAARRRSQFQFSPRGRRSIVVRFFDAHGIATVSVSLNREKRVFSRSIDRLNIAGRSERKRSCLSSTDRSAIVVHAFFFHRDLSVFLTNISHSFLPPPAILCLITASSQRTV